MRKFLVIFLIWAPIAYGDIHPSYPPHPTDTEGKVSPEFTAANAQAIYWINLIDQQQYWAAWLEGSSLFRDVISRDQWAAAMRVMRTPLGPTHARKVVTYQNTGVLPHGTRGNFMVIQYDTSYGNKANARETIILMTEGRLGLWKVVSYTIV